MKIKELLEYGKNNLIKNEDAFLKSKILLKYLLKVNDNYLIINYDQEIKDDVISKYKSDIKLLNSGMPIQYVTNHQEFMKIDFYVDENVLIPQPDTEILVEEAIKIINDFFNKSEIKCKVLDLCTGSGAIGISIAKYVKKCNVTMSDISTKALNIANKNVIANQMEHKCKCILSNMFFNINEKYDIIISNPPYIRTNIITSLDIEVQNEPKIALDGGEDGLNFYKIIAENAYKYLNSNGILALEIGYNQNKQVIDLLNKTAKYNEIYSKKDLSGNDRIIIAKRGD